MMNLGSWMNKILIGWGVDPKIANTFDEIIIAALLIVLAVGIDYLCQFIFVGSVRKLSEKSHYFWDTLLIKRKVVHNLVHAIPGILVYALLPMAFIRGKELLLLSQQSVRCLYRIRITIGDQRIYPCDNGYIQSQGSE